MNTNDYLNSDFGVLGLHPLFFGVSGHDWYCEDSDNQRYKWITEAADKAYRREKTEGGIFLKDIPAWVLKKYDIKNCPDEQLFLNLGDDCFAVHFALWYGLPEELARLVSMRKNRKKVYGSGVCWRILNAAICGWSLEDIQQELQRWEADRTKEPFGHIIYPGKYYIYRDDVDLVARRDGETLICEETGKKFTIWRPEVY